MNKKFYVGAVLTMALVGCNNDESIYTSDECQLKATVETVLASRVGFDNDNKWSFFWHNGDEIWVNESPMSTSDADKSKTATFTGYGVNVKSGYAVYPFDMAEDQVEDNVLTWNFPKTYTYETFDNDYFASSQDVPMYAKVENGCASFKHLGAVLVFKMNDWEYTGEQVLTVTTSKRITGEFTTNLTDATPVFTTTEEVEDVVTINFSRPANAEKSTILFYIPVPTGTYDIKLKITADGKTVFSPTKYEDVVVKRTDIVRAEYGESALTGGAQVVNSEAALQAAIAEGGEITLASPIVLTEVLTIASDKNVVLDLNGKTISQSQTQSGGYSMIENKGTLTIKSSVAGGTITYVDNTSLTDDVNYVSNTIHNSGTLTIEDGVTIINDSDASVASYGYPHVIDNSGTLTINGGIFTNNTNYSSIRIWCTTDDDTNVTINGGAFTGCIDLHNVNGNANKGTLTITGGTFNANNCAVRLLGFGTDVDEINGYISGGTFNGLIKLNNYTSGTFNSNVFQITGGTFSDLSALGFLSNATVNVTLADGATLTDAVTIAAGNTVTLDLNGNTISQTSETTTSMIVNNGTLTIKDSGDEGKIEFTFNGTVDNSATANAISNRGTLVVESGEISNTGTENQIGYAIDNYNGATLTINGGKITASGSSYYDGIRLFCGSNETTVTVNGGEVSSIWAQNPSANKATEVNGTVIINGGTVTTTYYENYTIIKVKTSIKDSYTVNAYGAGNDNTTTATEGEYTVYSFVH